MLPRPSRIVKHFFRLFPIFLLALFSPVKLTPPLPAAPLFDIVGPSQQRFPCSYPLYYNSKECFTMHIPACETTELELIRFDRALEEADRPSPDYDAER